MPSDAQEAAGMEGPGSGAAAGWCWQGNAMVTRRRDAEPRASSPRWGLGKKKGTMGSERQSCLPKLSYFAALPHL